MKLAVPLLALSIVISSGEEVEVRPRIAGGHRAKIFTVIYLVGIIYARSLRSSIKYGAGTLISTQWILTVREVLVYQYIELHLASRRSYRGFDMKRVYRQNFYFHPDKKRPIALVKCPFQKFDRRINKIRMPGFSQALNRFTGNMTLVCGYGFLKPGGRVPEWMQCIQAPIMSNEECKKIYRKLETYHMCTSGEGGVGACEGDIGGSVVTMDKQPIFVGIIYIKTDTCRDLPSIHIRVSDHLEWIRKVTGVKYL
ncbi:serine protease 1-like [Drosophila eugracilis]|uniref:serine protease 1-like n=1 Tax=Drosophila eugracilis TaxID=29029 RepID=UPI0007E66072|nr:serine protease 1-like [Drosophila eugracilis]